MRYLIMLLALASNAAADAPKTEDKVPPVIIQQPPAPTPEIDWQKLAALLGTALTALWTLWQEARHQFTVKPQLAEQQSQPPPVDLARERAAVVKETIDQLRSVKP